MIALGRIFRTTTRRGQFLGPVGRFSTNIYRYLYSINVGGNKQRNGTEKKNQIKSRQVSPDDVTQYYRG